MAATASLLSLAWADATLAFTAGTGAVHVRALGVEVGATADLLPFVGLGAMALTLALTSTASGEVVGDGEFQAGACGRNEEGHITAEGVCVDAGSETVAIGSTGMFAVFLNFVVLHIA